MTDFERSLDGTLLPEENHIMKIIDQTTDPVIEMLTTGKPIPEEVKNRLRADRSA